ncbi:MAG: transposase, partial [Brevinema sp.]
MKYTKSIGKNIKQLEEIRFKGSPVCPYCNSKKISGGLIDCKDYHCNSCNRNFTLYTKTSLHGKKLEPLILF